jgi:hypothetical protein
MDQMNDLQVKEEAVKKSDEAQEQEEKKVAELL